MASIRLRGFWLAVALAVAALALAGCGVKRPEAPSPQADTETGPADARFLVAVEDEPDTVDFQCTSLYYTVAQNAFNRLVEMVAAPDGSVDVQPSLAQSWEVSPDGRVYTFHLQPGVKFSNGAELTSSDVLYSFTRLLTCPGSCNQDIVAEILGAQALASGEAQTLQGFEIIDDLNFAITLENPFEAFLACLSMPGASIMDEQTTEAAGDRFGMEPAATVGTGPFILRDWEPGRGMTLVANPDCWAGPPACAGLDLRFMTESEAERQMFERGELDILDLDELGVAAEYFIHGDIYRERLKQTQLIGITYIALNASVKPLHDVRVRRALQYALNRQMLLDVAYNSRGAVENGIFPRGLKGYNPELAAIPFDPDGARALLAEAGYPDGFDLTVSVKSTSTQWLTELMQMAAEMWNAVGVRAEVQIIDDAEFMRQRKAGALACYAATWVADFNDPDNFIYTFFGSRENATFRSLGYADEAVMKRVREARGITDSEARIAEYRELERKIVQEDAAWVPLFSRFRYYVLREGVEGFRASWNGWVKSMYSCMSVTD